MVDLKKIGLTAPVDDCPITQLFGENPQVYKKFKQAGHNGVDYGCPTGTHVKAAASGVVVLAGWDETGYGNRVKLDHGGYETIYAHLSTVVAKRGQMVEVGEMIGASGSTGFSSGPHLHFELRVPETKSIDYPQGAMNPLMFMLALTPINPPLPEGRGAGGEVGYVTVSVGGGANLRLSPGGQVLGAAPYGSTLKIADAVRDWIGVIVWVHTSVVKGKS